jgi:hypothetical protein
VSEQGDIGPDRRPPASERPPDPAGTRPRHDPASLLPSRSLGEIGEVVVSDAVEDSDGLQAPEAPPAAQRERDPDLLPERRAQGGAMGPVAPPASPFAPRFHFLFGALAAIGAAALTAVLLVILTGGGTQRAQAQWSRWQPHSGGVDGARQIAARIGSEYRFPDGKQLVNVQASGLSIEGVPLSVALREDQAQGGDIKVYDDGGLIFRFCGLGPNCAIASGKPSTARHLLLRREALELSLYSFHYLSDVDQIVVFMPPPKGKKPSQALFFRRGDVNAELERPLRASLVPRAPTTRDVRLSPDIPLVDRITGPKTFNFSLTQANTDNRGFIVLDPLSAQQRTPKSTTGSGSQR